MKQNDANSSPAFWRSVGGVVTLGAAGSLMLCVVMAGAMWPVLLTRGATEFFWIIIYALAALGWGARPMHWIAGNSGGRALRAVSAAALGLGLLSLATLGLGLMGWLNGPVAWSLIAIGALLLIWEICAFAQPDAEALVRWWQAAAIHRVWGLLLMPPLAIAATGGLILPGVLWGADDPAGYDVVEYHLQVPRQWYEQRQITPLEENVFSYMPMNAEMQSLLAMHLRGGPWAAMYMAQYQQLLFWLLTAAAVWAILRERTASGPAAIFGAAAVATLPWTPMLASVAYNEGAMLLWGTLAVGWIARSIGPRYLLAGIFAGLACGAKLTALPLIFVGLSLWLLWRVRHTGIRPLILFIVGTGLFFSPWMIRNQLWAGNPFFPEALVLGHGHFTPAQVQRWQAAHTPRTDQRSVAGRAGALVKQVIFDWRFGGWPVIWAAIAIAAWRKMLSVELLQLTLGLLVGLVVFWLCFTHLQSRFFVWAIPLGAILIGGAAAVAWPRLTGLALAVLGCIGWIPLITKVQAVSPLLGLEDPWVFTQQLFAPEVAEALRNQPPVALVGEARAFWFSWPAGTLRYRTVFDVQNEKFTDPLDAWLGQSRASLPGNMRILIDPAELARFARTYRLVPVPPLVAQQPYLLRAH